MRYAARHWLPVLLTALCCCLSGRALAQFEGLALSAAGAGGGIVVGGVGILKLQPERLRLIIELQGKAGSYEEAVTNLKDRQDAAKMQLEAMGFDKDSVEMSPPTLVASTSQRQAQMEQMIRMQMAARGRKAPAKKETPEVVTLSSTLVADVPLEEALSSRESTPTTVCRAWKAADA